MLSQGHVQANSDLSCLKMKMLASKHAEADLGQLATYNITLMG